MAAGGKERVKWPTTATTSTRNGREHAYSGSCRSSLASSSPCLRLAQPQSPQRCPRLPGQALRALPLVPQRRAPLLPLARYGFRSRRRQLLQQRDRQSLATPQPNSPCPVPRVHGRKARLRPLYKTQRQQRRSRTLLRHRVFDRPRRGMGSRQITPLSRQLHRWPLARRTSSR